LFKFLLVFPDLDPVLVNFIGRRTCLKETPLSELGGTRLLQCFKADPSPRKDRFEIIDSWSLSFLRRSFAFGISRGSVDGILGRRELHEL